MEKVIQREEFKGKGKLERNGNGVTETARKGWIEVGVNKRGEECKENERAGGNGNA